MADVSAKGVLPGLRPSESDLSLKPGSLEVATARGSAFNAALAEGGGANPALARGAPAQSGLETSARPDASPAPTASARAGETVDAGKFDLPVLQLGSSDRTVGLLQRALALLGYPTPQLDNLFDGKTEQAVRSFQEGRGLANDGVVGKYETWPAVNQALVTRHEGVSRLADALGAHALPEPQTTELKQLGTVLAEFGGRTAPAAENAVPMASTERTSTGDVAYTVRTGETLADVARTFGLPVAALIVANPELSKPYLILQGQLLTVPNPVKERKFRKPPRQMHSADPDGHLSNASMNPGFVALVNGMVEQLRGEGHDVRVIDGFRSFDEQQRRFEQGRRSPGNVLTDVEAGHSWHNYGLAVDIALNDDDGRPAWPEDSALFWQHLGDVALAHGAVWGGLFGFPAHVEYHPQFERDEAGSLIEDFEGHGLEGVWERIALELPPDA